MADPARCNSPPLPTLNVSICLQGEKLSTLRAMIGLLQRVSQASIKIAAREVAAIGPGLVVMVGVERTDRQRQAERLLTRLLTYRVFADSTGRMNQSLSETGGSLLLVPQFTLAADTHKGTRPGFTAAAEPAHAEELFTHLCATARSQHSPTACGLFAATMQVALINDGPVTFYLRVADDGAQR